MDDGGHQELLTKLHPDLLNPHFCALDVLGRRGGQNQMVLYVKKVKGLKGLRVEDEDDVLVADDAGNGDEAVAVGHDVAAFLKPVYVYALKESFEKLPH